MVYYVARVYALFLRVRISDPFFFPVPAAHTSLDREEASEVGSGQLEMRLRGPVPAGRPPDGEELKRMPKPDADLSSPPSEVLLSLQRRAAPSIPCSVSSSARDWIGDLHHLIGI